MMNYRKLEKELKSVLREFRFMPDKTIPGFYRHGDYLIDLQDYDKGGMVVLVQVDETDLFNGIIKTADFMRQVLYSCSYGELKGGE